MRRLLLTIVTAWSAITMFAMPSAAVVKTDRASDPGEQQTDEVRPARPRIRCYGAITKMSGEPKVKCGWTESEHPHAVGYKIIRRGGSERSVVFRTGNTSVISFTTPA